jgi:hypothetical protein
MSFVLLVGYTVFVSTADLALDGLDIGGSGRVTSKKTKDKNKKGKREKENQSDALLHDEEEELERSIIKPTNDELPGLSSVLQSCPQRGTWEMDTVVVGKEVDPATHESSSLLPWQYIWTQGGFTTL